MTNSNLVVNCRVSGKPLTKVFDFGRQPLGNGFLGKDEFSTEYFFPMEIGFSEESMMLQLLYQPEPEKMFHDHYAFYSSTSQYMARHFSEFANSVIGSGYLEKTDPFVVELGCNDGIMLRNFSEIGIRHLGIEPSLNVAKEANKVGVRTVSEFFNENFAADIINNEGQADAFIAANVMCHIPDIVGVVKGIKKLIKPTGVVMFEDPYLGDIVAKTSYDQIYDEHVFLFSALSIQHLFGIVGMELIDLIPQNTHGGSMRYVLAHKGAYPVRDSVSKLLEQEKKQGLHLTSTFAKFGNKVEKSKSDLLNLLKELKAAGKRVAGYAATSKSTTVLNYCGVGPDLVEYICDTTPIKQGKFSPGSHIAVLPHKHFSENPPDYAILFAWNHALEIISKEGAYVAGGGRWIMHVPSVRIL
jgi:2-polyprenyl-3-methyl-5-hydroxy-6-metoxy-1,4-benzoquinol methylase